MAKTKISEFSATPANNTDIDSINIAEGCAPSGINDAIRELMSQLKDFQTGAVGDSFNGPVGTTTAAAGAFTTLSASSTVSGTGFSTYLASPPAIGGTAAAAGSFTTLTTSSTVTHNGGTANGIAYLNGSKVLTTGSALTFDGTNLGVGGAALSLPAGYTVSQVSGTSGAGLFRATSTSVDVRFQADQVGSTALINVASNHPLAFNVNATEQMRLTSTGLGIGTSSPTQKLSVNSGAGTTVAGFTSTGSAAFIGLANSGSTTFIGNDSTSGNFVIQTPSGGFSTKLTLDASGNLGIGTSSPSVKLHSYTSGNTPILSETSGGVTSYLGLKNTGGMAYIASQNNNILFATSSNADTRATIDSSGNLGLGVTPSASSASGVLFFKSGGQFSFSGPVAYQDVNVTYNSGADRYIANGAATRFSSVNGVMSWQNAPSGTAGNAISFTQAMTLTAGGNLLVGTTTDTGDKIHTSGSIRAATVKVDSGAYITGPGSDALAMYAGSAERARIDSSGNLLVGTTSAFSGSGISPKVTVSNSAGIGLIGIGNSDAGMVTQPAANTNYYAGFFLNSSSSGVGNIFCTGSSTAYNTSSDYRLKNTIAPMTGALAKVALLKPVTYKWNADGSDGEGFIAHELAEVVPQCVTGEKDAVDAEGNPQYQGIDTSFLVGTLTAAIQELKAIVDAQAARITALEAA